MYYCPICYENCATEEIFMNHWKGRHHSINSVFSCKQLRCSRVFSDVYAFKKHLSNIHKNERVTKSEKSSQDKNENSKCKTHFDNYVPAIWNNAIQPMEGLPIIPVEQQTMPTDSLTQFAENVQKSVAFLISKLYANPSLSRSFVTELVTDVRKITNHVETLKSLKCENGKPDSEFVNKMFDAYMNSFVDHDSEGHSFSYFQNLNTLIMPKKFHVDGDMKVALTNGERQVDYTDNDFSYIPIKEVLKHFLELPKVFETILSFIKTCEQCEDYVSVVSGNLWKFLRNCLAFNFLLR